MAIENGKVLPLIGKLTDELTMQIINSSPSREDEAAAREQWANKPPTLTGELSELDLSNLLNLDEGDMEY